MTRSVGKGARARTAQMQHAPLHHERHEAPPFPVPAAVCCGPRRPPRAGLPVVGALGFIPPGGARFPHPPRRPLPSPLFPPPAAFKLPQQFPKQTARAAGRSRVPSMPLGAPRDWPKKAARLSRTLRNRLPAPEPPPPFGASLPREPRSLGSGSVLGLRCCCARREEGTADRAAAAGGAGKRVAQSTPGRAMALSSRAHAFSVEVLVGKSVKRQLSEAGEEAKSPDKDQRGGPQTPQAPGKDFLGMRARGEGLQASLLPTCRRWRAFGVAQSSCASPLCAPSKPSPAERGEECEFSSLSNEFKGTFCREPCRSSLSTREKGGDFENHAAAGKRRLLSPPV